VDFQGLEVTRCGQGTFPSGESRDAYLVSLKAHEIGIIALLSALKEVIVEAGQISGYDTGSHVMSIEQAAYPGVSGRRDTISDEQR
jgi:hypothetical protein